MGRHIARRSCRGRRLLDPDASQESSTAAGSPGDDGLHVADPKHPRFVGGVGAHLADKAVARREARRMREAGPPTAGLAAGDDLAPADGGATAADGGLKAADRIAHRRKAKRKRSKLRVVLAALAVVGVFAVVGALGAMAYLHAVEKDIRDISPAIKARLTAKSRKPGPPVNMVVLGSDIRRSEVDRGERRARSDTLMVVRIDPRKKKIWVLSIPRDLRVEIPGYGTDKVNAAFFHGGPPLVIQTVHELTGLPIHDYVEVNFYGFKDLVDAIGGVWVNVDTEIDDIKAANYDDSARHIEPGYQKLDGKHALTYVRSRDFPEGDFKRIEHQQQFLDALLAQTVRIQNVFRIPQMIEVFRKNVKTSMSVDDMKNLALDLRGISRKDLYKARVMGQDAKINGIYFYLMDEEHLALMTQRMRDGEPFTGPATGGSIPNEQISITCLNGSGVMGRARSMTDCLRVSGFDVQDVGNARQSNFVSTLIVYKPEHIEEAKQVWRNLKIGKLQPALSKYQFRSDVLVIVGQDYQPPTTGAPGEGSGATP